MKQPDVNPNPLQGRDSSQTQQGNTNGTSYYLETERKGKKWANEGTGERN